jgi:Rps23 Pro-64 3,4-dihydroxylase Tpa1-like proline 4-hydroxylase
LTAERLTGILNLEHDPYLHGSGIHIMGNGDYLRVHLDYSLHPRMHKERRVNIIVFVSDWDSNWGGSFCSYPEGPSGPVIKVLPRKNRAIVFETTDTAWHGVEPIHCPDNVQRITAAMFYVSEPREGMIVRHKAQFAFNNSEEEHLSKIRSTRLLTEND